MPPPPTDTGVYDAQTFVGVDTARPLVNPTFKTLAKRMAAFVGPGYLVAVGYMDPGNWATDIAGGSKFGYALLPAIFISGLAAMFLQCLSLRLGIATGRDLAQLCRDRYSPWVARSLWVTCEIAIVACDLAEVIGTAIALKLLFQLPLALGVALTALDTLVILGLQKRGFRYIEAFVIVLTATIGTCFAFEMLYCRPDVHGLIGSFLPSSSLLHDRSALYLALGIFGATVMPHNLYLHSSIAQSRRIEPSQRGRKEAIRFSTVDCLTALAFALTINAAILVLAAAAFNTAGQTEVADIESASRLLSPLVGTAAAGVLFAVALLAAGQNSTLTGTMAGQIVMEGFLGLRMKPHLRRLLTRSLAVIPALAVTLIAGEKATTQLLIFSQVILSLQLGFAVIPLISFTSNRQLMGPFVSGRIVTAIGVFLALAIVAANLWLVIQALTA